MSGRGRTLTNIASSVRTGARLFTVRLFVLNGLRIISAVVLARFLVPGDYAAFGAIATFISFVQFAVDLGLGGAAIQQEAEPTESEMATIFSIQQVIAWLLVIVTWVTAPWLTSRLGLSTDTAWMLRAYAFILPITAARITPNVRLIRDLAYGKIAWVEIVDSVVLYTLQLSLAVAGARAWALILGGVSRTVTTSLLLSIKAPWRPQLRFDFAVVRKALAFAVPYQLNAASAAVRGFIPAWVLLAMTTPSESGLVIWSLGITGFVWQFAFLADRVMFPAFSRLVNEPAAATRAATTLLFAGTLGTLAVAAVVGPVLPAVVPFVFGARWAGAVQILQLLLWAAAGLVTSYLTASILNGMGMPRARLATVVLGGALELTGTLWLVPQIGVTGYAFAVGAAGISEALVALAFVRRRLAIHLGPLGAAVLAAGGSAFGASTVENPILGGVVALAIFATVVALLARSACANLVRQLVSR